jgi:hypothetical protein
VDNLLKRKAEEGVRIYILLWNEPLPFVNNFSREAESTLQALHPNIKVVRAGLGGICCFRISPYAGSIFRTIWAIAGMGKATHEQLTVNWPVLARCGERWHANGCLAISPVMTSLGAWQVRHPILNLKSILWSHHQKFVVIDQQLAFVGGLDICLGRYALFCFCPGCSIALHVPKGLLALTCH